MVQPFSLSSECRCRSISVRVTPDSSSWLPKTTAQGLPYDTMGSSSCVSDTSGSTAPAMIESPVITTRSGSSVRSRAAMNFVVLVSSHTSLYLLDVKPEWSLARCFTSHPNIDEPGGSMHGVSAPFVYSRSDKWSILNRPPRNLSSFVIII